MSAIAPPGSPGETPLPTVCLTHLSAHYSALKSALFWTPAAIDATVAYGGHHIIVNPTDERARSVAISSDHNNVKFRQ
jgi:hypothetical protein